MNIIMSTTLLLVITAASAATTTAQVTFNIKTSSTVLPQSTTTTPISATTPALFYYIETTIGKPPRTQMVYLVLDSVGPLTWVQASNCSLCFPSTKPFFDPSFSTALPAADPICAPPLAKQSPGNGGAFCVYDFGISQGVLARDIFHGAAAVVFGYGTSNPGGFEVGPGKHSPIVGAIGLGSGHPTSLLVQAVNLTQGRFSYCLPAGDGDLQQAPLSTLDLGGEIPAAAVVSRILVGPDPYYYIWVTGISANDEILAIDPEHLLPYSNRTVGSATYSKRGRGFIINPSTPVTVLDPRTQMVLRDWVVHAFQRAYGWFPKTETLSGLDLCYDVDPAALPLYKFPVIKLHFQEGGRLPLQNIFRTPPGGDPSELCMLVEKALGVGPSVLGSLSQVQTRFFYDVHKSVFAFKPDAC